MLPSCGCTHERQPAKSTAQTVVFVCEHGAAKSVIAAAYFNKLAAERHLNFHAVARGLTPQPELSTSAVAGLEKDGVPFAKEQPRRLSSEETRTAVRVVAFCPVPKGLAEGRCSRLMSQRPMKVTPSRAMQSLYRSKRWLTNLPLATIGDLPEVRG